MLIKFINSSSHQKYKGIKKDISSLIKKICFQIQNANFSKIDERGPFQRILHLENDFLHINLHEKFYCYRFYIFILYIITFIIDMIVNLQNIIKLNISD